MSNALLVVSLLDAGVGPQTIRDVMAGAGVSSAAIEAAFEVASLEGQGIHLDYTQDTTPVISDIPPPFEVSGGLGQASPVLP